MEVVTLIRIPPNKSPLNAVKVIAKSTWKPGGVHGIMWESEETWIRTDLPAWEKNRVCQVCYLDWSLSKMNFSWLFVILLPDTGTPKYLSKLFTRGILRIELRSLASRHLMLGETRTLDLEWQTPERNKMRSIRMVGSTENDDVVCKEEMRKTKTILRETDWMQGFHSNCMIEHSGNLVHTYNRDRVIRGHLDKGL